MTEAVQHRAVTSDQAVLIAEGIRKTFPGVVALDDVGIDLRSGEVHALCGENGAGKSTLMKVLAGSLQPDLGSIHLNGVSVSFESPLDAREHGILLIHQEISLVPQLSVAENIFLGRLPVKRFGSVDRRALRAAAEKTLRNCGYSISPSEIVGELPIAKQQMVEIARAMTFPFQIIIFDEPTAALTDSEAELLFENIHRLKEQNVAIVYVTHKMKEVFALADRITVLRDGRNRGTLERKSTTEDQVISLMIGRQLDQYFDHAETNPGPEVVRVESLSVPGFVSNVSFSIRAGEILGLYGLVGSGRSELAEAIFGLRAKTGKVFISGKEAEIHSAQDAVDLGVGLVPEDRKRQGLILQLGARDNIALALLRRLSVAGFTRPKRESEIFSEYAERLQIRISGPTVAVSTASGGNQQKVVLAKWLATQPKFLILDEPTRGIDVGAKADVHKLIAELARAGMAVLMISSEMPETIGVCHRILTIYQGVLRAEFDRRSATEDALMDSIVSSKPILNSQA
jgi:ribose transport system ATP-binding protein